MLQKMDKIWISNTHTKKNNKCRNLFSHTIFNINTILKFGVIWINSHSENSLKIKIGSKQPDILAKIIPQDLKMFPEAPGTLRKW